MVPEVPQSLLIRFVRLGSTVRMALPTPASFENAALNTNHRAFLPTRLQTLQVKGLGENHADQTGNFREIHKDHPEAGNDVD